MANVVANAVIVAILMSFDVVVVVKVVVAGSSSSILTPVGVFESKLCRSSSWSSFIVIYDESVLCKIES